MAELLNADEQKILEGLADPDAPVPDTFGGASSKWDQDLQREVLAMLLNDRAFLVESHGLVQPDYFDNEIHRVVTHILFNFWEKYKTLPNRTQINHELNKRLSARPDEIKQRYKQEFSSVLSYFVPNLQTRDYYLDKIVNFAKMMALKKAIRKVVDVLKKGVEDEDKWLEIREELKEALSVERDFDMGLNYFETAEERYARREQLLEKKDFFTSGFKAIDTALKNGGLLRGEMGAWMGLSGTGKSLCLVKAAIANLNLGKKVLYVTLEIDQDAVADRFDAQLANLKEERGVTVNNLFEKKDIVFERLEDYVAEYEDKRLMIVKQFPAGTLDVSAFRAYFSQIVMHNFRPDLVIIDYIGEMKDYPNMPTHESRYRIVRDLRGFASEEQVCVLTAMQPNKSGKETVRNGLLMDDEQLGDSFAQVKPLDALWSLNQMLDERDCGLARVNVAKHRDGKSRFGFHIEFNYDTLGIEQISSSKYEEKFKKHKNEKEVTNRDAILKNDTEKLKKKGKMKMSEEHSIEEAIAPDVVPEILK